MIGRMVTHSFLLNFRQLKPLPLDSMLLPFRQHKRTASILSAENSEQFMFNPSGSAAHFAVLKTLSLSLVESVGLIDVWSVDVLWIDALFIESETVGLLGAAADAELMVAIILDDITVSWLLDAGCNWFALNWLPYVKLNVEPLFEKKNLNTDQGEKNR